MIQETSAQAYYTILGKLGRKQEEVYLAIKRLGDATNSELSEELGLSINRITPRTKELRDYGLVGEAFRRPCNITGMMAIAWEVLEGKNTGGLNTLKN